MSSNSIICTLYQKEEGTLTQDWSYQGRRVKSQEEAEHNACQFRHHLQFLRRTCVYEGQTVFSIRCQLRGGLPGKSQTKEQIIRRMGKLEDIRPVQQPEIYQ